jgi:hydroxymethylglutaryl-CoA reductase
VPAPPAASKQPSDPVATTEVTSSIAAASSGGVVLANTGGKTVAADKRTVERSLIMAAQYMAARQFRKAREIYHLLTLSSAENLEALEQV